MNLIELANCQLPPDDRSLQVGFAFISWRLAGSHFAAGFLLARPFKLALKCILTILFT